MLVIDVNACFGKSLDSNEDLSSSSLMRSLDSHRVDLAFAYSLRGVLYNAEEGNWEAAPAARTHAALLPEATLDLRRHLGWEAEVERCLRTGVRVFRFFPSCRAGACLMSWSPQ